tara:strand:+ start:5136 stop:6203 length:1068 start_codon:yes stop_codon:yes gene_type:complete
MLNFFYQIKRLSSVKFRFDLPKSKKILQYDETHSDILKKIIKRDFNILPRHKTEIYFWIFIKQVFFFDFSFLTYFKNYVKFTSTKIVINLIDNDLFYYTLKDHLKDVYFIVIQNGVRDKNAKIFQNKKTLNFKNLKCDHFFVFNKYNIKNFEKKIKSRYHVLGNYKNNLIKINKTKYKNFYLFISRGEVSYKLMKLIATYFNNSNKKLYILIKQRSYDGAKSEMDFFNKFFNSNCIFLKPNTWEKSYKILDKFENIISTNSTLGYEAISRKKKVALLRFDKDNQIDELGWTIKNIRIRDFFTAKKLTYNEIKRVLDNVINCKQSHWEKKYYSNIKDLMYFDKNNSKVKKLISKLL